MVASVVDRETGETQESEERDVRVDPRFIQQRQGRPFITYHGLLDLLHRQSKDERGRPCFSVDTLIVQLPTAENGHVAVCTARVRVFDDKNLDVVTLETSGIGDADPSNVSAQMKPHLLRMAETRAKARALRDAVNVGMAALEELGPEEPASRMEPAERQAPAPGASPSVEGIVVEGRRFTRPQVEAAYKIRRAEAERLGVALPVDVAALDAGSAPLPVLVGATQTLKKLTESWQGGAPQGQR